LALRRKHFADYCDAIFVAKKWLLKAGSNFYKRKLQALFRGGENVYKVLVMMWKNEYNYLKTLST
jgi:hypothetical protein